MSTRLFVLFLISGLLSFASCKPSHDQSQAKVNEAEEALKKGYRSGHPESQVVIATIDAYEQFVKNYPKDTLSPIYLIKAGDCYRLMGQYAKAIDEYKKVESNYPDSKAYPNSIFIQGFVYENEMKNLPKAKERYQLFVNKFPNNDLAKAAKFSLDNLGVSPEELVKRFEKQNKMGMDSTMNMDTMKMGMH